MRTTVEVLGGPQDGARLEVDRYALMRNGWAIDVAVPVRQNAGQQGSAPAARTVRCPVQRRGHRRFVALWPRGLP